MGASLPLVSLQVELLPFPDSPGGIHSVFDELRVRWIEGLKQMNRLHLEGGCGAGANSASSERYRECPNSAVGGPSAAFIPGDAGRLACRLGRLTQRALEYAPCPVTVTRGRSDCSTSAFTLDRGDILRR
jgi:hypothetical protein